MMGTPWRKITPPVGRADDVPICRPPSDQEVQALAGPGSEWVCVECGRVWEVRRVGIFNHDVSLYPTKRHIPENERAQ